MLQVKNICKEYRTGSLVQKALDDVSLNLRQNEFVAILGPSGSGKTILLNIIGGLDRYDSGDLIINEISTKDYTDRDWDSYRNHTIGFVFQSYNLIPHQTILANVELALTISGISKGARRKKAIHALEEADIRVGNMLTGTFSTVGTNDLKSLKAYLDSGDSGIEEYTNAIEYAYNVSPQIYSADPEEVRQVHPDQSFKAMGLGSAESTNSMMSKPDTGQPIARSVFWY